MKKPHQISPDYIDGKVILHRLDGFFIIQKKMSQAKLANT